MFAGNPPQAIDKHHRHRYAERRVNLAQKCPLYVEPGTLFGVPPPSREPGSVLVALVAVDDCWTRAKRDLDGVTRRCKPAGSFIYGGRSGLHRRNPPALDCRYAGPLVQPLCRRERSMHITTGPCAARSSRPGSARGPSLHPSLALAPCVAPSPAPRRFQVLACTSALRRPTARRRQLCGVR